MDWTELRRASRHEVDGAEPDDARLARMRQAMDRRIAQERSTIVKRSRRKVFPALGGLVAAATVVVALVLGGVLWPSPGASAEAAEALREAATAVATHDIQGGDTSVTYQRWVTDGKNSLLIGGSYVQRRIGGSDVWERRYEGERTLGAWGPLKDGLLGDAASDPDFGRAVVRRSDEYRYFWDIWGTAYTPAMVRDLPRSPDALLDVLQGRSKDPERGLSEAASLLESGLADADLQAVVYRALTKIPGLTFERRTEDIDGRRGVGIGLPISGGLQRLVLVIDPSTGSYLGQTETNVDESDSAPAGTVVRASAVRSV